MTIEFEVYLKRFSKLFIIMKCFKTVNGYLFTYIKTESFLDSTLIDPLICVHGYRMTSNLASYWTLGG